MSPFAFRALAAAAVALLLFVQSQRVGGRSRRQRAFVLGSAAFGTLAVVNGLALGGIDSQALLAGTAAGIMLLVASFSMLVMAYRKGEMSGQFQRARDMVAEERAKRERDAP